MNYNFNDYEKIQDTLLYLGNPQLQKISMVTESYIIQNININLDILTMVMWSPLRDNLNSI